jgi:selenocysteine lyase/cysteine desulfurase
MLYFDNAASGGRKPDSVLSAVRSSIQVCANPGRSGHKLALSCANVVQQCRNALNEYFFGYGFDRTIFTKNCTEALNIALFGTLKRGDHVVATCMEHNSILRPLAALQTAGVITYDICPLDEQGNVKPQTLRSLVKENTRLVAVTSASNVTGATPPIAEIRSILPPRVLLLCDGAQGGGHLPLRMRELGVDLLALAGHKGLMAIQGSGALLFSDRVDPTPILFGGTGSLSPFLEMPDFYPDALEAGTLSFPAVVSLLEGVRYISEHERQHRAHLLSLTAYFLGGLKALPTYRTYSRPNACGIVAFESQTRDSETVAQILSDEYDIAVRGGLHCAPLMHDALKTADSGLVRVSFSPFNSEKEVDELLFALERMEKS